MNSEDPSGRRVHQRFEYKLPITVTIDGQEKVAETVNISLGGMFVNTEDTFEYGQKGSLKFQLPALKEPTEVEVTVRWVVKEGIGLQFGSLRALDVWGLNQLIK